jgi:DNA-binding CsgD family transcriptional regulator/PAS domain-containing protein
MRKNCCRWSMPLVNGKSGRGGASQGRSHSGAHYSTTGSTRLAEGAKQVAFGSLDADPSAASPLRFGGRCCRRNGSIHNSSLCLEEFTKLLQDNAMRNENQVDALIGRVYDAALDEKLWRELAPEIAAAFDSPSAVLQIRDVQHGDPKFLTLTENLTPSAIERYNSHYWKCDVWVQGAQAVGLSKVITTSDFVRDSELDRTEYYNDWLTTVGIYYCLGAVFQIDRDSLVILGIHRPKMSGRYSSTELRPAVQFLPHLERALQIRQRLAGSVTAQATGLDVLDRMAAATLVVSRTGRILYANKRAEEILRKGEVLRVRAGHITLLDRGGADRLARAIQGAVDSAAGRGRSSGGALAIPRPGRLPLAVLVAPFRSMREGLGPTAPAALIFIRDPEGPGIPSVTLRHLFGLTVAEAELASSLTTGQSLEEIAITRGVSDNTVRTQLKSVFAKTETTRQGQLVALLLRSVLTVEES